MRTIVPGEIAVKDMHQFLLGAVAPRPIAFVSTVDDQGRANLAPYSFFNAFSSNPPIVVFSSNRRVAGNTTKDTLHNVRATGECVVNVVSHAIVRQMAVASIQFPSGTSEFEKAGLTPIPSDTVTAPRVKESPAQMECKVRDIITLGEHGGAGHLIICDVLRMHVSEEVIDDNNRIDPHKIDLMGRLGRAYYVRASGDAVSTIVQPVTTISIGFEQLPVSVQNSTVLTGNDLGRLAGATELPSSETIERARERKDVQQALKQSSAMLVMHHVVQHVLADEDDVDSALAIALLADQVSQ